MTARSSASGLEDHPTLSPERLLAVLRVDPAQNVEAGIVSLAVTEGRIDRITVEGAGAERAAVEAIAEPLLEDAPLRAATLERVIGLIRDLPGISVTDVALTRGDADAGLYGLKIRVARKPVKLFTYRDNRGSESIGRIRFYSSVSLTSLAVGGDELRFDLFGIPGHGSRYLYGQVVASAPIGRDGLRMTLAASKGDQNLRSTEELQGNSRNFSAQLSYPMIRARSLDRGRQGVAERLAQLCRRSGCRAPAATASASPGRSRGFDRNSNSTARRGNAFHRPRL